MWLPRTSSAYLVLPRASRANQAKHAADQKPHQLADSPLQEDEEALFGGIYKEMERKGDSITRHGKKRKWKGNGKGKDSAKSASASNGRSQTPQQKQKFLPSSESVSLIMF